MKRGLVVGDAITYPGISRPLAVALFGRSIVDELDKAAAAEEGETLGVWRVTAINREEGSVTLTLEKEEG